MANQNRQQSIPDPRIGKIRVRIIDEVNGLQYLDNVRLIRLKSKNYKLLIMEDFAATLGQLEGDATFLSGAIVGLLRVQDEAEDMDVFLELLEQMDYFCGVSNPFTDLQKLDDCFHQAEFIVDLFSADSEQYLLTFQDCLLSYLLRQCSGKLPAAELEAQGIRILREYDARKGTDHLKTLETYLNNERSISRTAEALYIHRSSLLKRLDKIARLTDFDLDDADTRLYLRIYLRLMK